MTRRALAAISLLTLTQPALAQTLSTWTTPTSGTWTDAARWSTAPSVPNNNAPANTYYTATLPAGPSPYAVTLDTPVALASLNLNAATLNFSPGGSLSIAGTPTVIPSSTFSGSVSFTGTGLLLLDARSTSLLPANLATDRITVGPNITVHAAAVARLSNVVNQGTLSVDSPSASLTLSNLYSNTGLLSATNNATLTASITSISALGTFHSDTGGQIRLAGNIDNTSATLTLTAATGPLFFSNHSTLTGGTIASPDSTPFIIPQTLSPAADGCFLKNLTLATDLNLTAGGILFLTNVSVAGHRTITLTGGTFNGTPATPDGADLLFAAGTSAYVPAANSTSTLSLRTTTGDAVVGNRLNLSTPSTTPWTNAGSITVTAGRTLTLDGAWSNHGSIAAQPNSTLNLRGSFTTPDLGNLVAAANTLHLTGTLDNSNHTLDLSPYGSLTLTGPATLRGGTVTGTLTPTGTAATLDAVTLASDLTLSPAELTLTNGLTLRNTTLSIAGTPTTYSELTSAGSQTITGPGTISFDGSGLNALGAATGTLTLAPSITLRTGSASGELGYATGTPILLQGTLSAQTPGRLISVRSGFTNAGLVEARNGSSVSFNFIPANWFQSKLTGGSWAVYDNSSITLPSPANAITTSAATITLAGASSRFDPLNALTTNAGSLTLLAGRTFTTASNLTNTGSITAGPSSTLHVNGTLTNPGTLDLTTGQLLLTSTANTPDALRAQLLSSHLLSTSADPTHRLGYLDEGPTTRVTLTLTGDANLDGILNADDYALLDRGLARHLTKWTDGDFNYDGTINNQDYLLIDSTYLLQQQGGPSPRFLAQRESQFGADCSELIASVPEPTLPFACLFAKLLFQRRRRSRA